MKECHSSIGILPQEELEELRTQEEEIIRTKGYRSTAEEIFLVSEYPNRGINCFKNGSDISSVVACL